MTQKKARHLMMELSRRLYIEQKGTLKGFGKVSKFYNDKWSPRFGSYGVYSYDDVWNNETITAIRKSVGM